MGKTVNKTRNILAVSTHLLPNRSFGGPSTSFHRLLEFLAKKGIQITSLSSNPDATLLLHEGNLLNRQYRSKILRKYGFSVRLMIGILQEISKHHIILVNGVTNFPLTAVLAFAVIFRRKCFVLTRGGLETSRTNNWNRIKRLWYKLNLFLLQRLDYLGCLTIVYQSVDEQQRSSFCARKSVVVANYPPLEKATYSKNKDLRIGFVGRFSHEKGCDRLLALLKKLASRSTSSDVSVRLAIAGVTVPEIDTLAREYSFINVDYNLGAEQLKEFYANTDLLYFPSRSENFGNVVIEALQHGCLLSVTPDTHWAVLIAKDLAFSCAEILQVAQRWKDLHVDELRQLYEGTVDCVNQEFLKGKDFETFYQLVTDEFGGKKNE